MASSSPNLNQKKILKHQSSVKSEKGLKRVSLEVVDEKPSRMSEYEKREQKISYVYRFNSHDYIISL
jgi:negative regulator of genetic competence, sporulation and motility